MTNKAGPVTRVDPESFLREQRLKHAHVHVHQVGPATSRSYVVVGYDEHWIECELTQLTEDGQVLSWSCAGAG